MTNETINAMNSTIAKSINNIKISETGIIIRGCVTIQLRTVPSLINSSNSFKEPSNVVPSKLLMTFALFTFLSKIVSSLSLVSFDDYMKVCNYP